MATIRCAARRVAWPSGFVLDTGIFDDHLEYRKRKCLFAITTAAVEDLGLETATGEESVEICTRYG